MEQYKMSKYFLTELFRKGSVFGKTFGDAGKEYDRELIDAVMNGLKKVTDE